MNKKINIFIDMDGVLDKYKNVKRKTFKPFPVEFFANLEPYEGLKELNDFIGRYENVYILSKTTVKNGIIGKKIWLKKYLSNLKEENIFLSSGKKATVAENILNRPLTKNDILFDDYTANLMEWQEAGGYGIKRKNGKNCKGGKWQGEKIARITSFIKHIESIINNQ